MLDLAGKPLAIGDHVAVYNYKGKKKDAADKETGVITDIMVHNCYVHLEQGRRVFTSGMHLALLR
jgi:hypothetical protein